MTDAIICTIDRVSTRKQPPETLVTLAVPQEHAAKVAGFLSRVGDFVGVAFAEVGQGAAPAAVTPAAPTPAAGNERPRLLAEFLHIDRYFHNPALWEACDKSGFYTQAVHRKNVAALRCHMLKRLRTPCGGDVCAHHVKSAANAGVGIKPADWFTLPLCHTHHMTWAHGSHSGSASRADKEDMGAAAIDLTASLIRDEMKQVLGLDSLSELHVEHLVKFEDEIRYSSEIRRRFESELGGRP